MIRGDRRKLRLLARNRCEYCRLPELGVRTKFTFDHILPRQHGGRSELSNLAFACARCNLHKGPNLTGVDPADGRISVLFHPRRQKWDRHFEWNGSVIVGRTAVARTTVVVLAVNDPTAVLLRAELMAEGLFFESPRPADDR